MLARRGRTYRAAVTPSAASTFDTNANKPDINNLTSF